MWGSLLLSRDRFVTMFRIMSALCGLIALFFNVALANRASKAPHVLFILADDLGWSDVGFHGSKIQTPNIDKLAADGVILDNYYVMPLCSPTRSALLTGMYPIHTGLQHLVLLPTSAYGLPLNFTTLPQKLKESGYATHIVGKWHLGYNKWEYTPTYRGFDTFYGYYNAQEDHYSHTLLDILDFRDNKEPVKDIGGQFATFKYAERAQKIIQSHNASVPLFLYMAFQNVHEPLQAPKQYTDKYSFIKDQARRTYAGMVDSMDEAIGNITEALKDAGLWEDTLIVFSTDNGGWHDFGGFNWPLRGEKFTLWEGGVRGVSFVHGNMLGRRGVKCKGLMHVTDWFPTLVKLTGGSLEDTPLPLDGMDVWNAISEGEPSPRNEILLNIDLPPKEESPNAPSALTIYEGIALRSGDMKLLLSVENSSWFKPPELGEKPNKMQTKLTDSKPLKIALYNITADPEEREDLSAKLSDVVKNLMERVDYYKKGVVPALYGPPDVNAIVKALEEGVWTPWQD
ncbi:arylsulfatase B-like [Montipora capricornis]|uniref:arylsulfatase B-like n=1 Tax=Montipora foliosa TaxID=591990 RepID=UPI0035F16E9A